MATNVVYVVSEFHFRHGKEVLGVFTTLEKAQKAKKIYDKDSDICGEIDVHSYELDEV